MWAISWLMVFQMQCLLGAGENADVSFHSIITPTGWHTQTGWSFEG